MHVRLFVMMFAESGLSMVDWKLLGRKLPSSEEEWNEEFDKYKQFPEYQLKHYNISLQEYKFIYFMEWFHRMWGRAIGVAFAVPFVVFGARGMLSRSMVKKLAVAMGMGGCQGLVGWYMVKSGLEKPKEEGQDVNVSPYRLCMHLTSAFVIYSYVMWLAMSVLRPRPAALPSPAVSTVKKLAHASAAVLGVTIVSGKAAAPPPSRSSLLPQERLSRATAPACASPSGRSWATPLCRRTCGTLCLRGATCLRTRPPCTSTTAAWPTPPTFSAPQPSSEGYPPSLSSLPPPAPPSTLCWASSIFKCFSEFTRCSRTSLCL